VNVNCSNGTFSYGINTSCSTNYVPNGVWSCILDSCSGTLPSSATLNGTQGTAAWQYSTTAGLCKYFCQAGYYGDGTPTSTCTAAGTGTYVLNPGANSATACTNKPINSTYTTSSALTSNACPYTCSSGYHTEDGGVSCTSDTKTVSCTQAGGPLNSQYTIASVGITWNSGTSTWSTPANCAYTCASGYHTEDGGVSCTSDTKTASCIQSGAPATHSQYTVASVNITWNGSSWNTAANCGYTCTSGYTGSDCTTPGPYLASVTYVAGEKFTYNGATVTVTATGRGTSDSKYYNCPSNDIAVWTNGATIPQVWSLCNVGATVVFIGTQSSTDDSPVATTTTAGKFFQWGENVAWTYGGGHTTSDNCVWNRDTQVCGASAGLSYWPTSVTDTLS